MSTKDTLSIRQYCMAEGITLGAAYLRIWNKAVLAEKVDGRWRVYAKPSLQNKQEAVSA